MLTTQLKREGMCAHGCFVTVRFQEHTGLGVAIRNFSLMLGHLAHPLPLPYKN